MVAQQCAVKNKKKANSWPRGYKTFFMLSSAEHKIINAHKYKNIKKYSFFQAQISLECSFSCSFMSSKNSVLSGVEHETFITLVPEHPAEISLFIKCRLFPFPCLWAIQK